MWECMYESSDRPCEPVVGIRVLWTTLFGYDETLEEGCPKGCRTA